MKKENEKGKFPDLSGDGKVTQKDILMGKGVVKKAGGGMTKKGYAKGGMSKKGYAKGGMTKKGYAKGGGVKKMQAGGPAGAMSGVGGAMGSMAGAMSSMSMAQLKKLAEAGDPKAAAELKKRMATGGGATMAPATPTKPTGMKGGGMAKKGYSKGGATKKGSAKGGKKSKVRGAGIARKGVRPAKMR